MSKKIGFGLIFLVLCLFIGFFTWCTINCIRLYHFFDVEHNELMYEKLTFENYKKIIKTKNADSYEIYFEEYAKPFEISGITKNAINNDALEKLKKNTIMDVYYRGSNSRNYSYVICEMKGNNTVILSLSDYQKVNQNNQMVGMIVCPILVICCGLLLGGFIVILYKNKKAKKVRIAGKELDLGILRIEYHADGNNIFIYNGIDACSLVINNKIVDQYVGVVAARFSLIGEIKQDENEIIVEAKMGFFMMKLYYNGKLVKKKFMAFG